MGKLAILCIKTSFYFVIDLYNSCASHGEVGLGMCMCVSGGMCARVRVCGCVYVCECGRVCARANTCLIENCANLFLCAFFGRCPPVELQNGCGGLHAHVVYTCVSVQQLSM